MKYRIDTKNSQEKVISSKQHYMSFISDTFISNIDWDLIENNNNRRYHKDDKKNQNNFIALQNI